MKRSMFCCEKNLWRKWITLLKVLMLLFEERRKLCDRTWNIDAFTLIQLKKQILKVLECNQLAINLPTNGIRRTFKELNYNVMYKISVTSSESEIIFWYLHIIYPYSIYMDKTIGNFFMLNIILLKEYFFNTFIKLKKILKH